MKTTINYKLQDDIIGRQKRRVDNKHKHDQALLYHIQQEVLSGDEGAAQQTVKELQGAGGKSGTDKDKQEEAVRKLVRVTKPEKPVIIVYSNPNTIISSILGVLRRLKNLIT